MTCIVGAIPVDPPALFRFSGELCILHGACQPNSFGNASERVFHPLEPSRLSSQAAAQAPRHALRHRQTPFNPQYT
jgi:hypothetical protein